MTQLTADVSLPPGFACVVVVKTEDGQQKAFGVKTDDGEQLPSVETLAHVIHTSLTNFLITGEIPEPITTESTQG